MAAYAGMFDAVAAVHGWTTADEATTQEITEHEFRLYGNLSKSVGSYLNGIRREYNKNLIGQYKNEIKLLDTMMRNVGDWQESLAKDSRNIHDNVAKIEAEILRSRTAIAKARTPRVSTIANSARKASQAGYTHTDRTTGKKLHLMGGRVAAVHALLDTYDADRVGPAGSIPEVELYQVLYQVASEVGGIMSIDQETGLLSLSDNAKRELSSMQQLQLRDLMKAANAAQTNYVSEQRYLTQSWENLKAKARKAEGESDESLRAEMSRDVQSEIEKLLAGEKANMGLVDRLTAQSQIDKIQKDDALYEEQMLSFKHLGERIRGGEDVTALEVKAFSRPAFRQWAKENGFHIGYVTNDKQYIRGRDDRKAIMAWGRQSMRPNLAGSLSYTRFGSPGATTGEFVSFEVSQYDPDKIASFQLDNGMYAYDVATGKGLTPEMAKSVRAARNERFYGIESEGEQLLYDKQAQRIYIWDVTNNEYKEVPRDYALGKSKWHQSLSQAQKEANPPLFIEQDGVVVLAPEAAMLAKSAVIDENGRYRLVTEEDLLRASAPFVGDAAIATDVLAQMPDVGEQEKPPLTYVVRGEKMKLHAEKLNNPEYADGYIEIVNIETGRREIYKTSEIVGSKVDIEHRRGTDNFWTVRDSTHALAIAGREKPGVDEPMVGKTGYEYGGVEFVDHPEADAQRQRGNVWTSGGGWVSRSRRGRYRDSFEGGRGEGDEGDTSRGGWWQGGGSSQSQDPFLGDEDTGDGRDEARREPRDRTDEPVGRGAFEPEPEDEAVTWAVAEGEPTEEEPTDEAKSASEFAARQRRMLAQKAILDAEADAALTTTTPDAEAKRVVDAQLALEEEGYHLSAPLSEKAKIDAGIERAKSEALARDVRSETGEGVPGEPDYDEPMDGEGGPPSSVTPSTGMAGKALVQATRGSRLQRLKEWAEKRQQRRATDAEPEDDDAEDERLSGIADVAKLRKQRETRKVLATPAPKPKFDPNTLDEDARAKYLSESRVAVSKAKNAAEQVTAQQGIDAKYLAAEQERKRQEEAAKKKQTSASPRMEQPFSSLSDVR